MRTVIRKMSPNKWKKAYFILLALGAVSFKGEVLSWGGVFWRLVDIHWLFFSLPVLAALSLPAVTIEYSRGLTRLKGVVLILFSLGMTSFYLLALLYIGANSERQPPDNPCVLLVGLYCLNLELKGDAINLTVENGMGKPLKIEEFVVYGRGIPGQCAFEPFTLENGETRRISSAACPQPLGKPGDAVELRVNISYWFEDPNFLHRGRGEIRGTIQ